MASSRSRTQRSSGAVSLKLYRELASWWPLVSAPADYAEEATFYRRVLTRACGRPLRTVLELGSGGGNNASHLKRHFRMTLVDRSPQMLAVSRALNPECEHVRGDMRTVRLGRTFDAVFVHDAVSYIASLRDLRRTMATAFVHLRPGGAALFCPDWVRESFRPSTSHGGHDGDGRSARYLEWTIDTDPDDGLYEMLMVYVLQEHGRRTRIESERHVLGLFGRDEWLKALEEAGFQARAVRVGPLGAAAGSLVFVGVKPMSARRAATRRRTRADR